MREACYTSLRMGLYEPVKILIGADKPDAGFFHKLSAGGLAGSIASFFGNPFDVLKIRMMAYEGSDSPSLRYFANDLIKGQGYWGFYRGIETNIMRAAVFNGTKMGCYDASK